MPTNDTPISTGIETMEYPEEVRDPFSSTRQASVAQDLTAIFANSRSTLRTTAMVKTVEPRRRRRFSLALIGLIALALVGAWAGVALFVGKVSPTIPAMATLKTPLVHRDTPGRSLPIINAGSIPVPPAAAAASPLSSSSAALTARTPINESGKTEIYVRSSARRVRSSQAQRPATAESSCDDFRDEERAWCLRPSLLAAHRQLRATYELARRAGVDSVDLARIQGRWTDLQGHAVDRPDDTLEGYRDLRQRLLDLLAEQRLGGSQW